MSDEDKKILKDGTPEEKLFLYKKRSESHLKSIKTNIRLFLIILIIMAVFNYISLNKLSEFILTK